MAKAGPKRKPAPYTKAMGNNGDTKKTFERMQAVLAVLRLPTGTPGKAADTIGVARSTLFNWREADPEFAKAWDEAVEHGVDGLEDAARLRAVEGVVTHESWRDDKLSSKTITYSDGMLSLLLKGRRRSVFGDKQEVTGPQGGPIQHDVTIKFVAVGDKK